MKHYEEEPIGQLYKDKRTLIVVLVAWAIIMLVLSCVELFVR